ncbi:3-phosphoglycerate dehydrogenase (plasmid) [Pseudorhodobacter turbinis]|uniref:3-phosphoglycerate dehydrogenase n=1 Tax=Pseudorhodobacter turbinis TaxID=2500533 RepID=A0A4P8EKI0_9RHOB|nr:NAD(P)-dependent oxidoreductase [Pseudorhodobacter turbinis]QCO57730.1 3-phosphoglycerate dehydrogenase [Pseudorhodobacter turbinis]
MEIAVIGSIHPRGIEFLENTPGIKAVFVDPDDSAAVMAATRTATAILIRTSPLTAAHIDGAQNLKIVSRHGVGIDNVDLEALNRRRIPLTVIGDQNAVSVAEHAFYLMLAATKMGLRYDQATRAGNWGYRDSLASHDLAGKNLLVVGMGRIGALVAKRAQAFGMTVYFHDSSANNQDTDWIKVSLSDGLKLADVVSIHVPLLPATRNLIGPAAFDMMKPSSVLISTSRGGIVDEAALALALASGQIRAAGLDVFAQEPVTPDNPLLKLDNIILSPHMAAMSDDGAARMAMTAAQNCLDGINGRLDLSLVVNPEVLAAVE